MGSLTNGLDRLRQLADIVSRHGACKLPGISIDDAAFVQILRRAVFRGYVTREQAEFVEIGLRFGFDLGVDATKLKGRRHYRNYPTALQAQAAVTRACQKEVSSGAARWLLRRFCANRFCAQTSRAACFPFFSQR